MKEFLKFSFFNTNYWLFFNKKMHSKSHVLCALISICYLSSVNLFVKCKSWDQSNDFESRFLNLRYKPVGININTKKLQLDATPHPLLIKSSIKAKTFIVNTGQSVQTTNQIHNEANITGGVLQSNFIYSYFAYFWVNKDSRNITGTTIDDEGFPYEVRVVWRNEKYDKLSKAIEHQDGLVEFVLLYNFCSIPNMAFQPFGDVIKRIKKAESFTSITLKKQIMAANFIPVDSPYYSYSGSFLDQDTNRRYKCSTVIIIKPNPKYCITQKQFDETFGALKDFSGRSFANIMSHDSEYMNVSESRGVNQELMP